jgi:hypothetical protein
MNNGAPDDRGVISGMHAKSNRASWIKRLTVAIVVGVIVRRALSATAQRILRPRRHAPPTPAQRWGAVHAAFALLAIASTVTAVLTYSSSDLPAWVFALALLWFVTPLGIAHRSGDTALTQALLEEREKSLTVIFLNWLRWVAMGAAAVVASLYVIPVASLAYTAVLPVGTVSDGSLLSLALAIGLVGGGALAVVLYPFAAGVCEGMDVARWGGRRVTTPVAGVWNTPVRALFALSWALTTVVIVGAVYATQGALADSDAFDAFEAAGFDKDEVAIAAAVGGVVGLDVAEWVRRFCRQAATAALLVLAEFVTLGGVWIAMDVASDAKGAIWLSTPSVVVGALFGVWFALLLSIAQAIAAGMTALGRRRSARPYPEKAAWCSGIYAFGISTGAQIAGGMRVRTIVKAVFATRPAPRPTYGLRPRDVPSFLRAFAADWTGRWYLLCLASLPLTAGLGAFSKPPDGYLALLYIPLAIMVAIGFLVMLALFQAIAGLMPQDEAQEDAPDRD